MSGQTVWLVVVPHWPGTMHYERLQGSARQPAGLSKMRFWSKDTSLLGPGMRVITLAVASCWSVHVVIVMLLLQLLHALIAGMALHVVQGASPRKSSCIYACM